MPFQKYKNTLITFINMAKKISFCTRKRSENCIFGSFKTFSGAKIDFLPFLKMQIMCICTFEMALFSNFRALWVLLAFIVGQKILKKSREKKFVKSNKSKIFFVKLHFWQFSTFSQFKYWFLAIFEIAKSGKWLIWFHTFFWPGLF